MRRLSVPLRPRPSAGEYARGVRACLMACAKVISDFEVLAAGDAGRRRHWTDADKVEIVEESLRGQRQGSATARRHGISRSLLTSWRAAYRSGLLASDCPAFVPVKFDADVPSSPASGVPLAAPAASGADTKIEIVLLNGRRLTASALIDPTVLGRLLSVLEGS